MREIKFRGFSEQQNKWIYGGYHKPFEDISQIIENIKNNASQMSLIKNGTEGQFTGLQDKNGVDIYDGDVCNFKGHICIVVWRENFCDFTFNIAKWNSRLLNVTKSNVTAHNCEVIGNIHENQNLLK